MILTTRGGRQLVVTLAAVMVAAVVGIVFTASSNRFEAQRAAGFLADSPRVTNSDGDTGHQVASMTTAQVDEHQATVDLTGTAPDRLPALVLALGILVVFALVAGRRSTVPAATTGRAPPRG